MQPDFLESFNRGKIGEEILDKFFSRWYLVEKSNPWQEKAGIDRVFTPKDKNQVSTGKLIEYKTDFRAAKTERFYIEVLSHSQKHIPGWAYSSAADTIILFACLEDKGRVYCVNTQQLRLTMPKWENYHIAHVQNSHYFGLGKLVPIREIAAISTKVLEVN